MPVATRVAVFLFTALAFIGPGSVLIARQAAAQGGGAVSVACGSVGAEFDLCKTGAEAWAKKTGWDVLINKAGTTFRKLPEADREGLDEKKAIALMLDQPSMIKRPVLDLGGGKLLVGFKPELYAQAFRRA